jgi:hypothetical protein
VTFLSGMILGFSRHPWVDFSCPGCGTALRPKRAWLFVVNFASTLPALLLMQTAREWGVGLGTRVAGFVVVLVVLRILLTALLLRF